MFFKIQHTLHINVQSGQICMRVVPSDRKINCVIDFYFHSWIYLVHKVLSRFMQKIKIQPPACSDHGLHVLKPSFWQGHFDEKIRQSPALLWFGLRDDGILYARGAVIEQLMSLLHFWSMIPRRKKMRANMQTEHAGGWILFFAWNSSELCVPNIFKSEKSKKLYAVDFPIQWYHSHADLAVWYLQFFLEYFPIQYKLSR